MANLKTSYLGLQLKNPLVVGSSGLTASVESVSKLASNGAAAIVLKSIFEEEIQREFQNTLEVGLGSQDSNLDFFDYYDYKIKDDVLKKQLILIKEIKSSVDIPVIASINCRSAGEWVAYAVKLQEAGADALELNISRLSYSLIEDSNSLVNSYLNIITKVRQHVRIPVSVKLAPWFADMPHVVSRIQEAGVNGVVMFNRFYNPDIDLDGKQVVSGSIYSNANDFYWSMRWISIMRDKVKIDLAASTGIHTAETMIKMLVAGASAVQVVSAIYKNGPSYITDMLHGLNSWMEKKGLENICQVREYCQGVSPANPELFERLQFMRYFGSHG